MEATGTTRSPSHARTRSRAHANGSPTHCWHDDGTDTIIEDHGRFGTTQSFVEMQGCCGCEDRRPKPSVAKYNFAKTRDFPG